MRPAPDDTHDDGGGPSDDQDVPDDIHLPQSRLEIILGRLDIHETPDQDHGEQAEREVDEKEPLPFLGEGASDKRTDGRGKGPDTADDPEENTSFG